MKLNSIKLYKEQWLILAIFGAILLLGINWGLPDKSRAELLTYGTEMTGGQIEKLNRLRDDFAAQREKSEALAVETFFKEGKVTEYKKDIKDPDICFTEKQNLISLRHFILGSSSIDEMIVPSCLSRMDPARLDFDPEMYAYGGVYLYPIGGFIFLFKAAGLLHLSRDFSHYLRHPAEAALLYIPGRMLNVSAFIATLALLGLLATKLAGRLAGALAMLTYAASTIVLNYSIISKPHVYAAFWSFLALCFLYLYMEDKRKIMFILSVLAAGLAVGSSLPAGAVAVIYPGMLMKRKNIKGALGETAKAWAGMAIVLFITNPYLILSYDKYLLFLAYYARYMEETLNPSETRKVAGYFIESFCNSYAFPVSFFGLAALLWYAIKGEGFLRRLAVITLFLLVFFGLTLNQTRITLFLGPVICLFCGIALSRGSFRIRQPLRAMLLSALFLPGVFFSIMFARDVIFDKGWLSPTKEWVSLCNLNSETKIGVFSFPNPSETPPYPFLNCTLINMNKYQGGTIDPDYVLTGNYSRGTQELWNNHPLRPKYRLIYNLGYRSSCDWMLRIRKRNQARISGFVYQLEKTPSPAKNPPGP
ncbi:MAG: hypothetical protein JXB45_01340 [Candidatus Krumholzibacteriota bacterium]|nr:hypothetical protein [Candidatus Krumholzibacteriota bacterium]